MWRSTVYGFMTASKQPNNLVNHARMKNNEPITHPVCRRSARWPAWPSGSACEWCQSWFYCPAASAGPSEASSYPNGSTEEIWRYKHPSEKRIFGLLRSMTSVALSTWLGLLLHELLQPCRKRYTGPPEAWILCISTLLPSSGILDSEWSAKMNCSCLKLWLQLRSTPCESAPVHLLLPHIFLPFVWAWMQHWE